MLVLGTLLLAFAWALGKYLRDELIRKNIPASKSLITAIAILTISGAIVTVYGMQIIAHHGER